VYIVALYIAIKQAISKNVNAYVTVLVGRIFLLAIHKYIQILNKEDSAYIINTCGKAKLKKYESIDELAK
jgi:hypothetical protein